MSLTHLVETLHYVYKGLKFELRSFHLSTLRVKFLPTRLLKKKQKNIFSTRQKYLLKHKMYFIRKKQIKVIKELKDSLSKNNYNQRTNKT
jgi:hypothetical protein